MAGDGRPGRLAFAASCLTLVFLTSLTASAQENEESPEGWLLYSANDGDRSPGGHHIFVVDVSSGAVMRLTSSRFSEIEPVWSPDGSRIAFSRFYVNRWGYVEDQRAAILVMNADGSDQVKLTAGAHDRFSAWSPDGSKIAFVRYSPYLDHRAEIYVMDSDGGNLVRLTNNRVEDGVITWAPDGDRLAFVHYDRQTREEQLVAMNIDGTERQVLTSNEFYEVQWSPDGKEIAFSGEPADGLSTDIFIINSDGKNEVNITNNEGYEWWPRWTPDSKSITFGGRSSDDMDIIVADRTGADQRTFIASRLSEWPQGWSSDGEWLAFFRLLGYSGPSGALIDVFLAPSSGGPPVRVTDDGFWKTNLSWRPTSGS